MSLHNIMAPTNFTFVPLIMLANGFSIPTRFHFLFSTFADSFFRHFEQYDQMAILLFQNLDI